ncbi:MAG: serine/threonine protein kinase, partial [Candidatus Eremiobacteraeota bacterium]|nr:serine/threonine protein kinase [Candidatus Eremiobacteraeota bacterium]
REVSAYQKLAHPNIVRVVSWREMDASGDPPYIILELVPGRTLPQEGMSWPEARPLLEQIFSAVAFAHRHGVVHRDLKPDNIMVHQGRVKVMDFGLARNHDASQLTASGTVLGTPAYMAPEQLSQGSSAPAVDQYALGAVAYRLLSGRLPHEADDVMALFARVLSADPVPLDHYQPDLPPQVVAVVMRMLAHNQEHRFESVEEAWKAFPA